MKRHIPLALLRTILAFGIVHSVWWPHATWGESYPGDGQQAFAFIVVFVMIGFAAALVYLLVGSVLQFLLRRRRARVTVLCDLALFATIAGVLAYGGITATYHDTQTSSAAARS